MAWATPQSGKIVKLADWARGRVADERAFDSPARAPWRGHGFLPPTLPAAGPRTVDRQRAAVSGEGMECCVCCRDSSGHGRDVTALDQRPQRCVGTVERLADNRPTRQAWASGFDGLVGAVRQRQPVDLACCARRCAQFDRPGEAGAGPSVAAPPRAVAELAALRRCLASVVAEGGEALMLLRAAASSRPGLPRGHCRRALLTSRTPVAWVKAGCVVPVRIATVPAGPGTSVP